MKFTLALAAIAASVSAIAVPKAQAWADATPEGAAVAAAYADAYAEAIAIGHADPAAYAEAASTDDCADYTCHMNCGLMIVAGQACSTNTANTFEGPYKGDCLCNDDKSTDFQSYYDACMDCGWTLWKYYGGYLADALAQCNADYPTISTEPTGTSRCATTVTSSYTTDPNINYSTFV